MRTSPFQSPVPAGGGVGSSTDSPRFAAVARALRLAVIAVAVAAAVTLPVAVAVADIAAVGVLAGTVLVGGAVGWVSRGLPGPDDSRSTRARLAEVATAWILLATVTTVVTWLLAGLSGPAASALADPWGALFEAVSGITTTGLTMVSEPDRLSTTVQWWRTVLQAVGAAGMVVFALQFAEPSGDRGEELGASWSEQPGEESATAARRILGLYGGIATVGILGLVVGGERAWVAINHALTAAATGGFSITADSAASMGGFGRLVLATTCLVSAISYGTLWGVVDRSGPPLWRRTQVRTTAVLLLLLGGASVAFAVEAGSTVGAAAFNAVSASATAGFSAGQAHRVVPAVALVTMVAMLIGGSAGSTGGGIKVARLGWIAKSIGRWLPQGGGTDERPYAWDGERVEAEEAMRRIVGAGALIGIWLLAVIGATLVLAAVTDATLLDLGLEAVSAASGTGLSSGVTGPDLGWSSKGVLIALMLGGRLEFTAFLALVVQVVRRR